MTATNFEAGFEALDLADIAGRQSLDWQCYVVRNGMAKRADGAWAAFEVGVLVARQNGKNACMEVVELGWMLSEPGVSILHTAHEFQTALESMQKLEALIRSSPLTENEIAPGGVRVGNGKESIKLKNGSIIRFRTRTKSGGRGFSVDRLVIDEAMILSPASMAALMPLLTDAKRPQIWYLGSAADAGTHEYCHKWADLRKRALEGGDSTLAWFEWSAPDLPEDASPEDVMAMRLDPEVRAYANPSMGFRVTNEFIDNEMAAFRLKLDLWDIERLSIGNWPVDEDDSPPVFDMDQWGLLAEQGPELVGARALAIDMSADRKILNIAAGVLTVDGRIRLELGYHGPPGKPALDKLVDLAARWNPCVLMINHSSPAMSMLPNLKAENIEPEVVSSSTMAQAAGGLLDDVTTARISHSGDVRLANALQYAKKREMAGGGFGWDYRTPGAAELQAITLARQGLLTFGAEEEAPPPAAVSFEAAPQSNNHFDAMTAAF